MCSLSREFSFLFFDSTRLSPSLFLLSLTSFSSECDQGSRTSYHESRGILFRSWSQWNWVSRVSFLSGTLDSPRLNLQLSPLDSKTTSMVFRMLGVELSQPPPEAASRRYRSIFCTHSPVLAAKVGEYYRKL